MLRNMIFNRFILLLALVTLCTCSTMFGQTPPSTEDEYEKAYQKRINQEYIFGVYIPADLTEAFIQLNKLIEDKTQNLFKNLGEKEAAKKLHFGFGRWMIHNWGFYEGSRLSVYLNKLGLYNPDDMAHFLMITYHRNLNKQKLDVKPLIESIAEARLKHENELKLQGEIIHKEVRKVDPETVKEKQKKENQNN